MLITKTGRLLIRQLTNNDAAFILELVNQPAWLMHIGDKKVRSITDAENYIEAGPVAMYRKYGFGLFLVEFRSNGQAIGVCGLIKRDYLPEPDIGFAFMPDYWQKGYAFESATAVVSYSINTLGIAKILAITTQDNKLSIRLLGKLGFVFNREFNENGKSLKLYSYSSQ